MNLSTVEFRYQLALIVTTVLVAAVQLTISLSPLYGYDEAWHLYLSSVSPLWKALEEMAVDPHPPLYYFLLRPLILIGPEPFWPRLISVAATVLTVPLWYLVLRKLDLARAVAFTLTLVLASRSVSTSWALPCAPIASRPCVWSLPCGFGATSWASSRQDPRAHPWPPCSPCSPPPFGSAITPSSSASRWWPPRCSCPSTTERAGPGW